ncbi:MAG TPA: hypothetical protein VFV68_01055 [Agriterribacter sp.]|nr:hypothetical protein [Agriterribacter sp.]
MKEVPYTYQIIAAITAISFFVPFIVLMARHLLKHRMFLWFAVYWLVAGVVNLLYYSATFTSSPLMVVTERLYNLADAPFMLFILYKTSHIEPIKNSIRKMLPAFLWTALLITIITRLQDYAETLMVGVGLGIILMYIIWTIVHYIRGIKHENAAYSMQFIYYALLFEYGVSVVTFIYNYILPEQSALQDSFLIYNLSTIISVSVASYGLVNYKEKPAITKKNSNKKPREAEITFL